MKTINRASLPQSIKHDGREYFLEHIPFDIRISTSQLFDYLQKFKQQGRSIVKCMVLSRRLKGARDLHGKKYKPNDHYFVTAENNCTVRQDLIDACISVPVGDIYIEKGTYQYRWINEDVFQILLNGKWLNANSIDFNFGT